MLVFPILISLKLRCQVIINTFPYCSVDYLASIFAFVPPPDPLLYLQHMMSHLFLSYIPLIYPHYLYVSLWFKTLQDLSLFPALRSCHISLPYPYDSVTLCHVSPAYWSTFFAFTLESLLTGMYSPGFNQFLSVLRVTIIPSYGIFSIPFCKYIFIILAIEMAQHIATKTNEPSSIPKIHKMEGEKWLLQVFWPPHACLCVFLCTSMHNLSKM